ncbi:hypothetical protein GH741_01080 [Aquibacillus halophilus]|uniref:Uncharacterized protein n=1 Tax=Aquibacillus halophilus TaxID=930132 RepID=A0A6A8D699_9BACI|nr:hypothetical protein [Aquibacillus halophilus]MRH41263.1 hypothetical protein [Aquibacillus halophilus]
MNMEMLGTTLFIIACALVVVFGFIFAKRKAKGKPKRTKYIIRGITLIVLSPFTALVVGAIIELLSLGAGGGWMMVISLFYLTPVLFVVGLILLLIGIFKKDTSVEE